MALIQKRLGIEAKTTPGKTGQFDVRLGDETVATRGGNFFTRKLGMGYPDPEGVVDTLQRKLATGG